MTNPILRTNVSGLSFHAYGAVGARLLPGMRLTLKRVYDNSFDPNAVGVYLLDDQVGWIPKTHTAKIAELMRSKTLTAVVSANKPTDPDLLKRLFIVLYDEHDMCDVLARVEDRPVYIGSTLYYIGSRPHFTYGEPLTIIGKAPQMLATSKQHPTNPSTLLTVVPDNLSWDIPKPELITQPKQTTQPLKEQTMNTSTPIVADLFDANKSAAISAAFLEAGRIANNTAAKALAKKAPIMVRGYVETPIGALVIANVAALAAEKLRPDDHKLKKLTSAMRVQAFQALYQEFDVEQLLADMLDNTAIKRALDKLGADDDGEPAATPKPRRASAKG